MQVGTLLERMQRRAIGHSKTRAGDEIHTRRHRQHLRGGNRDLFGEATPAGQGDDAVAGREVADILAHGGNDAGDLATGAKR
ncbi:hypothetical protein D3C77_429520 [compost metagenome]